MNRAITLLSLALLFFGAAAIGGWFWAQGKVKAGLVNGIENSLNAGVHLDEVWLNLFSGRIEARNAKLQSLSESSVWKSATIEKNHRSLFHAGTNVRKHACPGRD